MEFIKDQEKRILLSAISREKKVIKEHSELKELIPVINQLEYYFMYDRLFKQIYRKGFMDGVNDTSERFKSSAYKQEYDARLLDKVMQKQRTIIDDDGVMYKVVFLKDIEKLKAEVSKNANES